MLFHNLFLYEKFPYQHAVGELHASTKNLQPPPTSEYISYFDCAVLHPTTTSTTNKRNISSPHRIAKKKIRKSVSNTQFLAWYYMWVDCRHRYSIIGDISDDTRQCRRLIVNKYLQLEFTHREFRLFLTEVIFGSIFMRPIFVTSCDNNKKIKSIPFPLYKCIVQQQQQLSGLRTSVI